MNKTEKTQEKQYEFVVANWYNALKQIKERKGRVARMSEFIRTRNETPFEEEIWQYGSYTSTTLDYAPNSPVLLLKDNSELLQLDNAEKAVTAHRNAEEYRISKDQYNKHLKQAEAEEKNVPEKRNIFILSERKDLNINSQNHFNILRFLAEDPEQAETYLQRLSEKDISNITLYLRDKNYVDKQKSPFQDQLWLHGLVIGSSLIGDDWDLDGGYDGVLGVFDKTAEGSPKKVSGKVSEEKNELYTPQQLVKTLKRLKISGLEESILNDLRKHS